MSDQNHQTMPIDPNVDPYGYMGMVRCSDGSITRLLEPSILLDTSNLPNPSLVLTKDLVINSSKNTWARVIVPHRQTTAKLPLVVYFHGGGFVMATVDTPLFQGLYTSIATEIPAIVVSVEYRRAPEDRLPAGYEDCIEALHWIKNKPDELFVNFADFSKCFLMGSSAGGNITYHLGLRAAAEWKSLQPLTIKGLILHQAYFGGKERTESESRSCYDKILPLNVSDIMWELALPLGTDRDHEFCNPMVGIESNPKLFDPLKLLGWKVLVTGCDGDPLIDRQRDLVKVMKELGVQVVDSFSHGGCHGLEFFDPSKVQEFSLVLKEFVTALYK